MGLGAFGSGWRESGLRIELFPLMRLKKSLEFLLPGGRLQTVLGKVIEIT